MLTSCAHRTPMLAQTARPDASMAILYGRFCVGPDFDFKNKLALWVQNTDDRKNVYLFFDADHPVYAVRVVPGHYRVVGFIGVNRTHQIKGRREFRPGPMALITRPFEATANAPVYLGDFAGKVTFDGLIYWWNVYGYTNNFTGTTRDFRQDYPGLSTVPATSLAQLLSLKPADFRPPPPPTREKATPQDNDNTDP